nr:hypothetical protein [Tanacetum cinerariifolium]
MSEMEHTSFPVNLGTEGSFMKDVVVASKIDISSNEYILNTGTSHEFGDANREPKCQRNSKGNGSFFKVDRLVKKAEKLDVLIEHGDYWYDTRAGFWDIIGDPCRSIIQGIQMKDTLHYFLKTTRFVPIGSIVLVLNDASGVFLEHPIIVDGIHIFTSIDILGVVGIFLGSVSIKVSILVNCDIIFGSCKPDFVPPQKVGRRGKERIRRRRYNLTPAESKFKNLMLDHQDKYMMKAQLLGLGYGALRHRELALDEDHVYSTFEPTLTTWIDLDDGTVYIDVLVYPPSPPPVQTPPLPEWTSGSLLISPSSSVVPSPVSSPMIPLTVPSPIASPMATSTATIPVNEDQFIEIGAHLELYRIILQDQTQCLDAMPPTLFAEIDRMSLDHEHERAVVTFGALWRLVLALEAWAGCVDTQITDMSWAGYDDHRLVHDMLLQHTALQRELREMRVRVTALEQERDCRERQFGAPPPVSGDSPPVFESDPGNSAVTASVAIGNRRHCRRRPPSVTEKFISPVTAEIEAVDSDGHLRSCPSSLGGIGGYRGTKSFNRVAGSRRIRVGSWNVRYLASKLFELCDSLGRHKVDIACFQDSKWNGSRAREGNGYKLWYSGSSKARNGVEVMVAGRLKDDVVRVTRRSDRIIAISVVIDGEAVNVISAYAPGNLNGNIGAAADGYAGVHGGFGFRDRNEEGRTILEFATAYEMVVANSFFRKSGAHLITFYSGGLVRNKRENDKIGTKPDKKGSTYCSWYKLKLLDNAADSRLRLLEESATADDKMKK